MDMDSGLFQASFMQGPYCGGFPPAPAPKNNSSQLSGGLARYHSAPSSVLQGLLDDDDDDFYIDTDDSEMSRLLNDGIGSFASLLDTRAAQQAEKTQMTNLSHKKKAPYPTMDRKINPQRSLYVNKSSKSSHIYPEHPTQSPLSSISEHVMEDQVDDYSLSSTSTTTTTTPTGPNPNPSQVNQQDSSSCNSGVFTMDSNPISVPPHLSPSSSRPPQPPPVSPSSSLPPVSPSSSLPPQPPSKPGLMRHSSSPAGFLNRLIIEEANERAMMKLSRQHYSPLTEVEEKPMVQGFTQLSIPQMTMAGQSQMTMPQQPKMTMPQQPQMSMSQQPQMMMVDNQPVANSNRMATAAKFNDMMLTAARPGGGGLFRQSSSPAGLLSQIAMEELGSSSSSGSSGHNMGIWDADFGGFGQRKRGRGGDDSILKTQQRSPTNVNSSPQDSLSPTNTMPGGFDDFEGSTMDSVLCKARAKRGYATHPRSIAERVRRTKISERIKKLQDLVPNLDKQANTADMLDEVVEYVKNLQRQVQELSLHRPMCTCALR